MASLTNHLTVTWERPEILIKATNIIIKQKNKQTRLSEIDMSVGTIPIR